MRKRSGMHVSLVCNHAVSGVGGMERHPGHIRRPIEDHMLACVRQPGMNIEEGRQMNRYSIGYGAHPPNPNCPNQARLAVNFVLNFNEGSEPSVPRGDASSGWG